MGKIVYKSKSKKSQRVYVCLQRFQVVYNFTITAIPLGLFEVLLFFLFLNRNTVGIYLTAGSSIDHYKRIKYFLYQYEKKTSDMSVGLLLTLISKVDELLLSN